MSALDHLRLLAQSKRPDNDGLLGNTRFVWGHDELIGEEAILASFSSAPFDAGDVFSFETSQGAAMIGNDRALIADLYEGRIGRIWRVGGEVALPSKHAIDIAFDADMRQERGDISFRAEDHPELEPDATEALLSASRDLIDQSRRSGNLRVRGFVVRAFGNTRSSVALLSLFTLDNEVRRSAAFRYAVIGIRAGDVLSVCDRSPPREWTPRL